MNDFGTAVREALRDAGCEFLRRGKGDHDISATPAGQRLIVPVKIKS